jgi:hypothetical protein
MAYIYMIGWKVGYLFPSSKEIDKNPPSDGIYKTCISADELRDEVSAICQGVLKRKDKLALHFTQSTGYLFAIWQFPGVPDKLGIAQAAGHCYDNRNGGHTISGYCHDADSMKHAFSLRPGGMKKEEMLGPWKSLFNEGGDAQIAAALESSHWHKPLPEIARGFVEEVVKVNPNDPKARNPIDLFEKVRAWRQPRTDAKAALLVCCCPLGNICDFEINSFLIYFSGMYRFFGQRQPGGHFVKCRGNGTAERGSCY